MIALAVFAAWAVVALGLVLYLNRYGYHDRDL